ncbi:tRNA (adenosine(37)-N6)-threonylcarbamoyltransferase complex ATPase subunit type 1 TsaE [Gallibacterium anatis]|uniref:tRNA threonylcarbamoyladenosine biosynthesis protein TsaE n=2 Tax=Gallibacterium TaxID=155493 RepID=A0A0A3AP45_9PAST|nr:MULTISPECIES: tRNA (adenosine(37)-N6)-threonylcarbamoyltransferase complex ATPase subunit type 1 TsaE [Gallibacterium]KGQ25981.1 ATPase [Gallibacterium anatis CCM5995]KGQ36056.1 ATPase [Gallibacterium anatis]KGQ36668.1 ATPase [Gallibacterium genomosp. 1]KGQ45239.1 ATPase [Gallibacterium anatis]KGQ48894.1 ATPase [Gallibacterium anatis]
MAESLTLFLANEEATIALGQKLSRFLRSPTQNFVIYLNGQLGAGKTTLTRAIIQAMGYNGNVKSPTYALVEEYHLQQKSIYHFDLYRLSDPEELEFIGFRDYFRENTLCLLEWAEKGGDLIPQPDLLINIEYQQQARQITLTANSDSAAQIICALKSDPAQ